jgi:hypothetical protein
MARLLAYSFTISLDGYGAGLRQSRENPRGVGGDRPMRDAFIAALPAAMPDTITRAAA